MLIALACTAVVVAVAWLLNPPMFCYNDDSKMQFILSGAGSAAPSGHAVFINIVLGELIATLFAAVPSVPWWFVWQEACVCASVYLWCLCVCYAVCGDGDPDEADGAERLPAARQVVAAVLAALSSGGVLAYAASLVSFTLTAGVLAASAVMLQGTRMARRQLATRRRYGAYVAAMAVAAYATRPSAALAALPFALLLFVPMLVDVARDRSGRRQRLVAVVRAGVPLAVGVALAAACGAANTAAYAGHEWQRFLSDNAARHKYMDAPHDSYDENPELYASVGWSEELTELVRDEWFFMDERVTSEAFLALDRAGAQREQLGLRDIVESWRYGEGMFESETVAGMVVLIALCAAMALALRRDGATCVMVGGCLVACAAEIYYLEMRARLVPRVALVSLWPALALVAVVLATRCWDQVRVHAGGAAGRGRAGVALRGAASGVLLLAAARLALAAWRTDAWWKLAFVLLCVAFAVVVWLWDARVRRRAAVVVAGLLVPTLALTCVMAVRDVRDTLDMLHRYQDVADGGIDYIESHPDSRFFTMVSLFSTYDPWRVTLPANMTYVGGWEYYLPANVERMARLRGDDAHNYDILLRDDVLVLALTDEQADCLKACIEQVTGRQIVWTRAGHPGFGSLVHYATRG